MSTGRQHLGYATLVGPDVNQECDTFTCAHCGRVVHIPPKANPMPGGTCGLCGHKLICDACVKKGICDPLEAQLQRIEAQDRFRRSLEVG